MTWTSYTSLWDYVRFVLDQQAQLGLYSASSRTQQSTRWHITPLGHIILLPWPTRLFLTPKLLCVQQRSSKYQFNCLWFDATGFDPTTYCIRGVHANKYTTYAIDCCWWASLYTIYIQCRKIYNLFEPALKTGKKRAFGECKLILYLKRQCMYSVFILQYQKVQNTWQIVWK